VLFWIIGLLLKLTVFALKYMVLAGSALAFLGQFIRPGWMDHPIALALVAVSEALVRPVRYLMEGFGVPTKPLDFSPVVTVLFFELLQFILGLIFR